MRIERDPYNSILLEAYNLYIADWCNTRGYALTDVVQAFIEDDECSEFQDHDYMQWLLPDELYRRYLKEME